jgi:hypothetical protein
VLVTKDELVALVEAKRNRIESILSEQSAQQLNSKIQGDWSFKDTLAHIVFWDGELVNYLEGTARGQFVAPQREDDDTVNARVYHANRGRSLDEVTADFRRVYERLANFVTQADEEQLAMPSTRMIYWSLASHIVSNMEHVDEHLAPVEIANVN